MAQGNKSGWIRFYRKEHEWMQGFSNAEVRYYFASRQRADWDTRHETFGTFDCRTKVVKQEMLPDWSVGSINAAKRSLLKRGVYQKTDDPRLLKITNASLFLPTRGKRYEKIIQDSEINLLTTEYDIQWSENRSRELFAIRTNLANEKRMKPSFYSNP